MGNIYKRGKIWYVDVRVKGRRVRKRIGSSKRIAELALRDAEVQAAREEFGFSKTDITLDKFFELFRQYSGASHRPNTTDRYRAVINHFREFLKEYPDITFISEVNSEQIDRYKIFRKSSLVNGNGQPVESPEKATDKTRKGAKAHTINFELDALRLIFNQAIKWGYLKENPTKWAKRLKVDDAKPPRFLTIGECRKFLDASPPELYPVYFTFLNTGMRRSELENLQWKDVDLERRRILIRFKENWQPKSGERDIPINENLHELLKSLFDKRSKKSPDDYVFAIKSSSHSRNWTRDQLIKIAKEADIEGLTKLHTLRHTFASHLVMNGVDLPTVKKLLGHSDIQTTMIYAHLAPDHLEKAVGKLKFKS
ncbi:MAG: hypothetical protein CVT49_03290 [candidate division Zixibacteria bacterium HGW-Zixibacteria-1]|nr:MAG: hypothetical protein CVT49_03290 [candidate division Zixibacteria bacterium HGW-Zixibacteria-1]